jgi:simple sugar transport system ATP-binding protein
MVGRDLEGPPPSGRASPGAERLEVRGLSVVGGAGRGLAVDDVSFAVRGGEILGVAGVDGNGQAELVEALVGLRRPARGDVLLDGRSVTDATPRDRRRLGLGYVPEDRHRRGLILELSVADNLLLGRGERFSRLGVIDRAALDEDARALLERFEVRPGSPAVPVRGSARSSTSCSRSRTASS